MFQFAEAVENLFNRLDEFDVECIDRFAEWFSIHLSNFEYKWTWANWDYIFTDESTTTKTSPPASPSNTENKTPPEINEVEKPNSFINELKRKFVTDVLERTVRLAYWERVRPTIPEEFAVLLPSKPVPNYKFDDLNISTSNIAYARMFYLELVL